MPFRSRAGRYSCARNRNESPPEGEQGGAPLRIRLLSCRGEDHAPALAAHVRALQADGPVLFVTADRPARRWEADWAAASVDPDRLVVIDVVSAMGGAPARSTERVQFVPSPAMLELVVLRVEQAVARTRAAHVVLDSLNMLALYNGVPPVQAFAHYLVNRLRAAGVSADLVVRDTREGALLRERLEGFVDGSAALEAPA